MKIEKVAVIGAGTMGSGIAGQVANAGVEVWLLDLPQDDNPNALAERGLERLRDPNAPGLLSKEMEANIHLGNTRDDFDRLAECDWIAEAVVERLDIKKDLYRRLDAVIKADAIVTSNTSTIPIRLLVEDMPQAFRQRFAITHFFNPVRFMRLLELVRGENTDAVAEEPGRVEAGYHPFTELLLAEIRQQVHDLRVGVFAAHQFEQAHETHGIEKMGDGKALSKRLRHILDQ